MNKYPKITELPRVVGRGKEVARHSQGTLWRSREEIEENRHELIAELNGYSCATYNLGPGCRWVRYPGN